MISRAGNKNFLVGHYEWLALGVAVLALAGAAFVAIGAFGEDPEDISSRQMARFVQPKPGDPGVKPPDLSEFERATALMRKAPALAALPDKGANFLSSERRVFCEHCHAVRPGTKDNCPACGKAAKVEEKVVYDTDGDGIPDEWEVKYGLDPKNPADAAQDKDGDGFTNLEEFEAKTDPTDRNDHTDYLDFVTVQLPVKETYLPFLFEKVMKIPAGYRFYFKDPKSKNDYGKLGRQYTPLSGEEIGKTGYTVGEYTEKSAKRKLATVKGEKAMERTIDVSTASVIRKSDGKKFELTVGDTRFVPVDVQATLTYSRDGGKEFTVVPGDKIELGNVKYLVKSVVSAGKGAKVTLEHGVTGKARIIEALAQ